MSKCPEKLYILYVGTLPPHPGGGAISCSQLIIGFANLGHRVRALAPITVEALRSGDDFSASHPQITVTRFPVSQFHDDPNILPSVEYHRQERDQIREILPVMIAKERPDVIIVGRGRFVLYVPDIAKAYSIPCILRTAGATTLGILKGAFPEALAQKLITNYFKLNLIISPAKHLAESIQKLNIHKIKVIPNAVDLQQFYPQPKDEVLLRELDIQEDIIAVHVSNLKTLKRPLDIVSSAEQVLKINSNLAYVVVGDGLYRGAMEEACQKKKISDKFRFIGWIDYSRVPAYINVADIVVMPSEAEAQARVYLETQACARLLLASDIPGAREVIVDGETGILFRKGNIDDLTTKVLLAARDLKLRAVIGQKAREQVKSHSIENALTEYIATFKEVIQEFKA